MKQGIIMLLSLGLCLALCGCKPGEDKPRLAVISTRDVMTKCNLGIRAVEDVQKTFADRKNALKQQEIAIQKLQATPGISDPKSPRHSELQRLVQEFNTANQQFRRDVATEELNKFKPVVERLNKILAEYAKEKGLLAIQDKNGFAYLDPSLDITQAIITRLDAANP